MKTQIWAHRGASAYAPENTLEAFRLAAEMGADGVELDVQLSRDGELVVAHDETIDRVSNGTGYIKDYTLAQLKELSFNRLFPAFKEARIPTLLEVYELLKPAGLTVNVELKTGIILYPEIEEKVLALTASMGMEDRQVVEARAYRIGRERVIRRIIGDGPGRCGKCQEKRRGRNQFFHDYAPF